MKRHQHHGGAWKVAYADFITAMMALFMVLWLTAQDTRIKEAVERAFRNPFSAVAKESVGIIPNKDVTASQKSEGKFQSVSAVEMETMRRISEDLAKILQQQDEAEKSVQLDLTPDGVTHLDNCLLCEACTNVCPAGVQMEPMGIAFREALAERARGKQPLAARVAFGWLFGDLFRPQWS